MTVLGRVIFIKSRLFWLHVCQVSSCSKLRLFLVFGLRIGPLYNYAARLKSLNWFKQFQRILFILRNRFILWRWKWSHGLRYLFGWYFLEKSVLMLVQTMQNFFFLCRHYLGQLLTFLWCLLHRLRGLSSAEGVGNTPRGLFSSLGSAPNSASNHRPGFVDRNI